MALYHDELSEPSTTMDPNAIVSTRKAQHCRFIDTKKWREFARLLRANVEVPIFAPDGAVSARFEASPTSRDAFVRIARDFVARAQTIHQVHNAELHLVSDSEVKAVWSMEDYLVFPSAAGHEAKSVHGYGHYYETWALSDGDWLLSRMVLRRTLLEQT